MILCRTNTASVQGNQVVPSFPGSGSELSVVLVAARALVAEVVDFELNVGL